jgi:phosphoribosylformylglycinamidine synthase
MLHFYRVPGPESEEKVLQATRDKVPKVTRVQTEACFNVEVLHTGQQLSEVERSKLLWLFTETFEPDQTRADVSYLTVPADAAGHTAIVEVGPRMAFSTAWSSNCASMCQACGVAGVGRIERSRRYLLATSGPDVPLTPADVAAFAALVHDRMTECVYAARLHSFANGALPTPVTVIPVLSEVRRPSSPVTSLMHHTNSA